MAKYHYETAKLDKRVQETTIHCNGRLTIHKLVPFDLNTGVPVKSELPVFIEFVGQGYYIRFNAVDIEIEDM